MGEHTDTLLVRWGQASQPDQMQGRLETKEHSATVRLAKPWHVTRDQRNPGM